VALRKGDAQHSRSDARFIDCGAYPATMKASYLAKIDSVDNPGFMKVTPAN
jgi:hypothetical protein